MEKEQNESLSIYSEEVLKKIGELHGNLNTKIMKLQYEIGTGKELIKKLDGVVFSEEIQLALDVMIGMDLNGSVEASKEKILKNQEEIKRIKNLKEVLANDPKILEVVAEFFSIVYQPEK